MLRKIKNISILLLCIIYMLGANFVFNAESNYAATANNSKYQITFVSSDMNNYPRVRLYCKIKDNNGNVVNDFVIKKIELKEKLFGGQYLQREVKISERLGDKYGLNTSMVIDKSESIDNASMGKIKNVVNAFAKSMNFAIGDKAEIIAFNQDVDVKCDYTNVLNSITSAVNGITPSGKTALYDAIYAGVLHSSNVGGARCVIAFTDGADNASNYKSNDVITFALKQQVPVYIIGVRRGVRESDLRNIAERTNGKYWNIDDLYDLEAIFKEIYDTEKSTYYIEYETSFNGDEKYDERTVDINITNGNDTIHTESTFTPVLPQKIGKDSDLSLDKKLELMKTINEYSVDTDIDEMDTISFGKYEQDGNVENGSEDIEWILLDRKGGKVMLMSRIIIENNVFNANGIDNIWENSDIRKFMNENCYNAWFSDSEKTKIVKTNVATKNSQGTNIYTDDNLYLLNEEECRRFFGKEDSNQYNKRIATHITEYLKATRTNITVSNKNTWYKGNSSFWLRDAGKNAIFAKYVGLFGRLNQEGDAVNKNDGIRPVMWVKY